MVGAGALGTLFGAFLARDAEVRILTRTAAGARAIAARGGVEIEGGPPRLVTATRDPGAFSDVDVVLIAVKTYDTVAALSPLRGELAVATPLVSLQNGIESVAHIVAALGERRAIALAPTTEAAVLLDVGVARRAGRGVTTLGWAEGRGDGDLARFANVLANAGLAAIVARPIEGHVWAKAIVNAAINPLTALARVPNGVLLERPELTTRLFAIAREAAAVATAAGVSLPFDDAAAHVAGVVRATSANRSSMLQDFERGRPTEIEAIDGAIVRVARRLGIAVPEIAGVLDEVRARTKA